MSIISILCCIYVTSTDMQQLRSRFFMYTILSSWTFLKLSFHFKQGRKPKCCNVCLVVTLVRFCYLFVLKLTVARNIDEIRFNYKYCYKLGVESKTSYNIKYCYKIFVTSDTACYLRCLLQIVMSNMCYTLLRQIFITNCYVTYLLQTYLQHQKLPQNISFLFTGQFSRPGKTIWDSRDRTGDKNCIQRQVTKCWWCRRREKSPKDSQRRPNVDSRYKQ